MTQTIFDDNGFELATKRARKRVFHEEVIVVVPWARLVAVIKDYAATEKFGRLRFPIEAKFRIHFLQLWNIYSDPAIE